MKPIDRRKFIKNIGKITGGALVGGYIFDSLLFSAKQAKAAIQANVYIAKNGTPAENVAKVIDMRFGGIENFIGIDDIVIINPNGQSPNQGASNCQCCMGLIDLILNRPGGFNGEIIFCENTQGDPGYWFAFGSQLDRNGPYNFSDLILYYQNNGYSNVNGVRIQRNYSHPQEWPVISGPEQGQGWVRPEWQSPNDGLLYYLSYPIIRSPYSNKLIDLKNGIYDGGYNGQPAMKYIKVPTLNNHGDNAQQDYAGITSAIKSHLGVTDIYFWYDDHYNLHSYHWTTAWGVGEAIGAWMNHCRPADFYLTTAEWVGWGDRTSPDATQARTVGLCDDPVSLDYYMSKYVLYPIHPQQPLFNPDHDPANNNTRKTIDGCHYMGYGTNDESEIAAFVYDFDMPKTFRFDIDRKISQYRSGNCSIQDVLDLIEQYNSGN
jgi:hypothetical protein